METSQAPHQVSDDDDDDVPLVAPEPPPESNTSITDNLHLRHRRPPTSSSNSADATAEPQHLDQQKQQIKPQKKRRQLQWIVNHINESQKPTKAQETVFLTMQLRKMRRRVHGRKVKGNIGCEMCLLALFIFGMFAVSIISSASVVEVVDTTDDNNSTSTTTTTTNTDALDAETNVPSSTVVLLVIILWLLVAFIIVSKSPFSPWMRMLKWMVLFLPLLWGVVEAAFYDNGKVEYALSIVFVLAQSITFVGFVAFYKIYPMCLKQHCSVKGGSDIGRVAQCWRMGVVSDWTMSYNGINHQSIQSCKATYTCKYEGEICPETHLPQGLGRWLDDAWEGEMITGYWKQGQPVAPFSSWSYGTDDAVSAVRVAYCIATDDPYNKNEFFASNSETMPTYGVASVECSVSGSFYQHLPEAMLLEGPYHCDPNSDCATTPGCYSNAIQQCIRDLNPIRYNDTDEHIEIRANDTRGVQVVGHMYQPTGKFFARDVDSFTVEVVKNDNCSTPRREALVRQQAMRFSRSNMFLPRASSMRNSILPQIKLVDIEMSDSGDSDSDNGNTNDNNVEGKAVLNDERVEVQTVDEEKGGTMLANNNKPSEQNFYGKASLRVQNWIPIKHKEALLFLPGYNSCTKDRLENFGQFLAMSKLSSHVYPFVFCWPGGVGPGYFQASRVSGTIKNFDNLHKLVASLQAAGIRAVHFMTHSMGAQSLLGAFHDNYDENGEWQGRSKLSLCFQLDPAFDDEELSRSETGDHHSSEKNPKLMCKTITMLNPDFPLEAFVNRGFVSIRRICRTVTIVGDRHDHALWWSSLLNGVAERKGYQHCQALRPTVVIKGKRSFRLQERIGRSIDSLHFSPTKRKGRERKPGRIDPRLVFQEHTSLVEVYPKSTDGNDTVATVRLLDMDVVDMTGLDTNIAGLRHSGFSLNSMLLKDLAELLTTGKRAMKRSTLVYRDGNMFSYANAPSFVSL